MELPQSNIDDIIKSESALVVRASEKYRRYFSNAMDFHNLLNTFIVSINKPDRFIFVAFLSQIRKHHLLAILSTARLHHVQTMMDLRQTLEAGSCAAFAIPNPDLSGFAESDDSGILDASQELSIKRYSWLDANYRQASETLKNLKKSINSSAAHANIVYAQKNFEFDSMSGKFLTPFFDFEEERHVKSDFWLAGNLAMGIMDLIYGVDKPIGALKFANHFIPRLKALEVENQAIKMELMADPAFKKFQS